MLPKKRDLESYIHDDTLKTLVIANWLAINGIIKYTDEVTNLTISAPNAEGVRTIRFNIEPVIQVI